MISELIYHVIPTIFLQTEYLIRFFFCFYYANYPHKLVSFSITKHRILHKFSTRFPRPFIASLAKLAPHSPIHQQNANNNPHFHLIQVENLTFSSFLDVDVVQLSST